MRCFSLRSVGGGWLWFKLLPCTSKKDFTNPYLYVFVVLAPDSRIGCYVTIFQNISNLRDVFYREMSKVRNSHNLDTSVGFSSKYEGSPNLHNLAK